jgi:radical SAM-linked protein
MSTSIPNAQDNPKGIKYLLTFSKTGQSRFLSHLELSRLFIRAIKRAELRLTFSKGFHPMPKISFLNALPVGTESLHESLVIELEDDLHEQDIKKAINHQIPENINIMKIEKLSPIKQKLRIVQSNYRITLKDFKFEQDKLDKFLFSDSYFIIKNGKRNPHTIDARKLIKDIKIMSPDIIEIVIAHGQGPLLRPDEFIGEIFGIHEDLKVRMRILKTKQLVSADA